MNAPQKQVLSDSLTQSNANNKKRNLTIRFCVAAILVTSMLVVALTAAAYLQIRSHVIQANFDALVSNIDSQIPASILIKAGTNTDQEQQQSWAQRVILSLPGVTSVSMYDREQRLLWSSDQAVSALNVAEQSAFNDLLTSEDRSIIVDPHRPQISSLERFFGDKNQAIPGWVKVLDSNGQPEAIMRLVRNYNFSIEGAQRAARRIFWYIMAGNLLLFFALFYNFQRGLQTIESQEKTLNQQISRLSNLLSINKSMQKSMKTASSRAVEMNEQFLRRVGSDLHDGPAQSLGYAILRLNKISDQEESKGLGVEFHAVRDALDNSLEEIRGISSGLVLPELEHMTLEEALNKIVKRHAKNSPTEVTEYYTDLPDEIPLPIKITAYRFVQEGLNNAHRHGQAEKCRVTALVKNDLLHLSLKDNGMGFRKSQLSTEGGHLGLMGLKDRVESLGGRFSINSELGVGTAIKVTIALNDEAIPI